MAMIAMTTSSSMRVKAARADRADGNLFMGDREVDRSLGEVAGGGNLRNGGVNRPATTIRPALSTLRRRGRGVHPFVT